MKIMLHGEEIELGQELFMVLEDEDEVQSGVVSRISVDEFCDGECFILFAEELEFCLEHTGEPYTYDVVEDDVFLCRTREEAEAVFRDLKKDKNDRERAKRRRQYEKLKKEFEGE